jgi:hypothetical protein
MTAWRIPECIQRYVEGTLQLVVFASLKKDTIRSYGKHTNRMDPVGEYGVQTPPDMDVGYGDTSARMQEGKRSEQLLNINYEANR